MNSQATRKHLDSDQKEKFKFWLKQQLASRCQKNPRYSLRNFSRTLKLDPSTVSQILNGKRFPSRTVALEICERLSANPKQIKNMGLLDSTKSADHQTYLLAHDTFSVIADWYHYAILELSFTKAFEADPRWVGSQLGISSLQAKDAIERLLRLGLLIERNGRLQKAQAMITNDQGINTSGARKSLQKQIIAKALEATDSVPQEEKDITSITMAIDPKNLDRARELTKKYRRQMCALLEDGEQTQVYNLAIQLYPISKSNNKE